MNLETYLKQPIEFQSKIKKYLKPSAKMTIFEVGACEGEDTIKLQRLFPKATIHAFEPLSSNIAKMRQNYKKFGLDSISIHQLALSDETGSAKFYVSSGHPPNQPKTADWDYGNKSSSLLKPKQHKKIHKWVKFQQKIKVKVERLDDFCAEQGIDKLDFLYIDVQGAELKVLQGAGQLLKTTKLILLEVEAVELYKGQPLRPAVEQFMAGQGFQKIGSTVGDISGDQLYLNEGLQ